MLKYSLSFILVLLTGLTSAQDMIQLKGVLHRSAGEFSKGDTITLVSQRIKIDGVTKQYGYISYGNRRFIDEDRIEILNPDMDFWEEVWFTNRADEINKVGWESEKRQELYEDAIDYYTTALKSNLVFEDELLSDYLYQLTLAIHPFEMLKERQRNFSIFCF